MVARGDLGVELPLEQVPLVQKRAVSSRPREGQAGHRGHADARVDDQRVPARPVRRRPTSPTPILDGADALMLSGETSIGRFPVESVADDGADHRVDRGHRARPDPHGSRACPTNKGDAICRAAVHVANQLGAKFLVAFTETGRTPTVLARYRSSVPLLAFTPEPQVRNQLSLTWGVESFLVDPVTHTDHMVRQVEARLLELDRCVDR